ncbi:MAG: sulfatase-like hydrolase/transferase [Pseudomonadales bacterium]|nr:sulfatase-like hydrolase/transferase [Pseudomonadales bacterium]
MTRPNFLIFMPDQLRADCVGCFGNPWVQTPNIDALAARGLRFDNAWVNHPVCGPSRVNLMTGWYPHVRGHRTLTHLVQPHEPNLMKYMKDAGYHVAFAGARGDVFAPGVTEASTHFCGWTVRPDPKQMGMGPQYDDGSPLYNAFYHGMRPGNDTWLDFDEAATRTALQWLDEKPAGPFCLWVPLIFPHLPFEVEDPFYNLYTPNDVPKRFDGKGIDKPLFHEAIRQTLGTDRVTEAQWAEIVRVYYGMISRVDSQLGRIMAHLEATGHFDDTIVIFLTDHGEYLGDFGLVEKWPSGLDRCLLQNPLIMAGPGIRSGATAHSFVEMVDILPTLLELADTQASHTHFGRSLVPLLEDPRAFHRAAAYSEGGFSIDELDLLEKAGGEYARKAQLQHDQPRVVGKAISRRDHEYTYVYRLYEQDELYDRASDPNERTNIAARDDMAPVVARLRSEVLEWLFATADVIPWTADPRFPKIPHGQHEPFEGH